MTHFDPRHHIPRRLLSPNGGESYPPGGVIPIRWKHGYGDSALVTLRLLRDNSTDTTLIVFNERDTTGAYDWLIPPTVPNSSSYRVEVVHTAGNYRADYRHVGTDKSDGTFVIASGGPGGPPGLPSCPVVDTRTDSGWSAENSILGRSLDGALREDMYRLRNTPQPIDGRYKVRVRENDLEFTTLDLMTLLIVDHEPVDEVFWFGDHAVAGSREGAVRITRLPGEDVTSQVMTGTNAYFIAEPGDTLLVEFAAEHASRNLEPHVPSSHCPGGGSGCHGIVIPINDKAGGMASDPPREVEPAGSWDETMLLNTGVTVQAPDGSGGWRTVTHIYPRKTFYDFVVDSVGSGPVRLVFVGRHKIRNIARVIPNGTVEARELGLLSAVHSTDGDVGALVEHADGITAALVPGDTLTLEFEAPAVPEGKTRSWFLASFGVYTSTAPEGWQDQVQDKEKPALAFSLGAARPNPTTGQVRIGFTLARDGEVRIKVYDVAGRFVRTLVQDEMIAGPHEVVWDARDETGARVSGGVYFYRMDAGDWRSQRKVVFLSR